MVAGYLNLHTYHRKMLKWFRDESIDNSEFDKLYGKYKDSGPFNQAARLVRFLAPQHLRLMELINTSLSDQRFQPRPVTPTFELKYMFTPHKDFDKVNVFVNLPLNPGIDSEMLNHVSWILYPETLLQFYDDWKKDMDGKGAIKWATPRASWRVLKRYETMTIARALTRYSNIEHCFSAAQIRDLAAYIEIARKPFELLYADKPEDFIQMYSATVHSCMSNNKANDLWKVLEHAKHHPTSFFSYHPHVRGVYAIEKGKIAARTFLYQQDSGKWKFGRVYGSNAGLVEKFQNAMKEVGYQAMPPHNDERGKYRRNVKFSIPGIPFGGDWMMPVPYCDNLTHDIRVDWNKDKKEFDVECGIGPMRYPEINVAHQSTSGYILASALSSARCRSCQKPLGGTRNLHTCQDGTGIFCSTNCMNGAGYSRATRGDGVLVVIPTAETIGDARTGNERYTNVEAAKNIGCLPYITNLDDEPSDEVVTRHGTVVRHSDGQLFRLNGDEASRLVMSKMLVDCGEVARLGEHGGNCHVFVQAKEKIADPVPVKYKLQKVVEWEENEELAVAV